MRYLFKVSLYYQNSIKKGYTYMHVHACTHTHTHTHTHKHNHQQILKDQKDLPKDESSKNHYPEPVDDSSQGENKLTQTDENTKYQRSNPDSKHTVEQKTTKYGEDDVWPGINGIEKSVMGGVDVHHLWGGER